ncbi:MAG TPA: histidine phosphatase family protein [Bacteroidales bacterium]|nr:histidine phosphatase family protein [Bacteroidales bacterium]HPT10841.1 histidine phosphatase family protein [Bacteroidales bacterium]
MKWLYLVRHGKASWEEAGLSDADRPLLPVGIERTQKVTAFLLQKGIKPDLILSSPATRALDTALIIAKGLNYPEGQIRIERKIYTGFHNHILDLISEKTDEIHSILITGHNPVISRLANHFLKPGIENMPTSSVVCLSFPVDRWKEIRTAHATREFIVYPKQLP